MLYTYIVFVAEPEPMIVCTAGLAALADPTNGSGLQAQIDKVLEALEGLVHVISFFETRGHVESRDRPPQLLVHLVRRARHGSGAVQR